MSQLSPEVTDHQTRGAAAKIKNISALFFFFSWSRIQDFKETVHVRSGLFFFSCAKNKTFLCTF